MLKAPTTKRKRQDETSLYAKQDTDYQPPELGRGVYHLDIDDERLDAIARSYHERPVEPDDRLELKTKRLRERVWSLWQEFVERRKLDSSEQWIQLCHGNPSAVSNIQAFLHSYAASGTAWRVCLGPEEYRQVHVIRHATTIEDAWAALVKVADHEVMRPKIIEHPSDAALYSLGFSSNQRNRNPHCVGVAKSIPDIVDRLRDEGTDVLLKSEYKKRAMSASDLLLILNTLWTQAEHISARPSTRSAFDCSVKLAGLGGWRPLSVVNKQYRDVRFYWMKHPKDANRIVTVAKITIHHVKIPKGVQRTGNASLEFGILAIPTQLICLLRSLVARAIADDAFEAGYRTAEEVLWPQHSLGDQDVQELPIKSDFQDKYIIPISYTQYYELFLRTLLVAGLAERLRPYSLRVGAAGRLDGVLTDAARNFILSQSTDVFQKSYQPHMLQQDLVKIAFGNDISGPDEGVLSLFNNATWFRDPYAPIYIKPEDIEKCEKRNDLRFFQRKLQEPELPEKEKQQIRGRMSYIRQAWDDLKIQERRVKYFEEVRKLQVQGLSTLHLREENRVNPRRTFFKANNQAAAELGAFLADPGYTSDITPGLVAYLLNATDIQSAIKPEDSPIKKEDGFSMKQKPRCFFPGCLNREFSGRGPFTRHFRQAHKSVGKAFSCPVCIQEGRGSVEIKDLEVWCSHIARWHGSQNAPPPIPSKALCLLCDTEKTVVGFTRHIKRKHSTTFESSFPCPECGQIIAQGQESWEEHVADVHPGGLHPWGTAPRQSTPRDTTYGLKELARRAEGKAKRAKVDRPD